MEKLSRAPFVKMNEIEKRWAGNLGVEGITLDIQEGQFVALLGPSGCGKSTTLRLLAGLETSDRGSIEIDGVDVTGLPASGRDLSMVFQSYALFPHLSVEENVVFGLKVRRVPQIERAKMLNDALEITGLVGLESRKPGELSGGQRQRVALARAIVAGKKLCLMDEPLSNLDAKLRHSVRKDIKNLQKKLGITVVYVTHDQTEAMSMADAIVLMKDGNIQQIGSPDDLYNRPVNTFVAEFVGSPPMALIDGSVIPGSADDQKVGIRTEHIELRASGEGMLVCQVRDVEYLGPETLVELSHEAATGLVLRLEGRQHMKIGTEVEIGFERSLSHIFDHTGKRQNVSDIGDLTVL